MPESDREGDAMLSTIAVQQAHTLSSPPEAPRVDFATGDTLWPRAPAKTVSVAGRQSLYKFLRNDFKYAPEVEVESRPRKVADKHNMGGREGRAGLGGERASLRMDEEPAGGKYQPAEELEPRCSLRLSFLPPSLTPEASLSLLPSPSFTYWERYPVLIKTEGALLDVLDLETALTGQKFKYMGDKYVAPYRNVKFIRGTFAPKEESDKLKNGADLRRALKGGYTLQFYGVQNWLPTVASMTAQLSSEAVGRPANVNLYVTPPGRPVSLVPHSDFQCSLMVQLTGRKRWRLWKKPDIWLPVRPSQVRGRDDDDELDSESLGRPYMDVELGPGDILYVPRGCLHATSTPEGSV